MTMYRVTFEDQTHSNVSAECKWQAVSRVFSSGFYPRYKDSDKPLKVVSVERYE